MEDEPFDDASREEIKGEISDLEDRLGDLRSRRADVEEQLETVRAAVDEATEGVAAAPGESGAIEAAVDRRARRDTLADALDRLDERIDDADATLKAARQHLANLEQAERLAEIVEDGAEAHDELEDALRAAVDAVLDHLDDAADARERLDDTRRAFTREAGGTKEARVEAARRITGDDADGKAVSLLLSSEEARAAGLPRVEVAFPIKAEQTDHPADTAVLVRALRSALQSLLNERGE